MGQTSVGNSRLSETHFDLTSVPWPRSLKVLKCYRLYKPHMPFVTSEYMFLLVEFSALK